MSLIGGRALDGRRETLRAVAFADRDATGRASSVRLYTDTSPPFAQSTGVA